MTLMPLLFSICFVLLAARAWWGRFYAFLLVAAIFTFLATVWQFFHSRAPTSRTTTASLTGSLVFLVVYCFRNTVDTINAAMFGCAAILFIAAGRSASKDLKTPSVKS